LSTTVIDSYNTQPIVW